MPDSVWQSIVAVLLVVVGGLFGLGYDNVIRRIRSLERRQSASLAALIFIVSKMPDSNNMPIVESLREALRG